LNRNIINLLRWCRHVALLSLAPLDYLSRFVNDKRDLPPLHLRRYVGPLRSFESSGAEFMSYLRLLAALQPDERVLDIGCGCGQMALYLRDYLDSSGSYVGVDIHGPSISWCQRKLARGNFRFERIDVHNEAYNPAGLHRAEVYRFPFADASFDVILLKSVFTHMRPPEVSNYLGEVARLLKTGGRCLVTFFLLNADQATLVRNGQNALSFAYGEGVWRYRYEHSPESAIAYDEAYVTDLLKTFGLRLKDRTHYGTWTGRKDGLSFQDMLLLEK
jgi:ubiquinone/menaquinone biosynthesis C-methylase UbiE